MGSPISVSRINESTGATEHVTATEIAAVGDASKPKNIVEQDIVARLQAVIQANPPLPGQAPVEIATGAKQTVWRCNAEAPDRPDVWHARTWATQRIVCDEYVETEVGDLKYSTSYYFDLDTDKAPNPMTAYLPLVDDPATPYRREASSVKVYQYSPK